MAMRNQTESILHTRYAYLNVFTDRYVQYYTVIRVRKLGRSAGGPILRWALS